VTVPAEQPIVLVADDSAANRLTLKLELIDRGFAVEEAADGSHAIGKLGSRKYAAVVTDVWMPGADGIQVVQAIRKVDADIPVFVITGGGPGLSIASAAALAQVWGARKVYVKPFDVRELVSDLTAELAG
jgi:CheY-like chemotaxis protein